MITLVILNWRRPRNLEHLIARYRTYDCISEIMIVCNAGSPFTLPAGPKNPVTIRCNADLGLFTRFAAAALAQNPCVLHTDDDLLVPRTTIEELHRQWSRDPDCCHGLHGRAGHGAYDMNNIHGQVPVVLTRCLMTSRLTSARALSHAHVIAIPNAVPRGNGEDIILSFTAMMYSGRLNHAFPLPYTELAEDADDGAAEATSIHRRWSGHVGHRTEILRRCRAYFGLPLRGRFPAGRTFPLSAALGRAALRIATRLIGPPEPGTAARLAAPPSNPS
jgi:hypothetical protein